MQTGRMERRCRRSVEGGRREQRRDGWRENEEEGRTLEKLEASGAILPPFHGQSAGEGLILMKWRIEEEDERQSS